MMEHSFDVEVAAKFGIDLAVVIRQMQFWVLENRATGKHRYEGRTWICCSVRALCKMLPYFSKWQLERILKKLTNPIGANVLMAGNFNHTPHDRTRWFAFRDETTWILPFTSEIAGESQDRP